MTDYDVPALVSVSLPSKATFHVYPSERAWFREKVAAYLRDFHFTNAMDLSMLDQLVKYELLDYRWTNELNRGLDMNDEPINEQNHVKRINDMAKSIEALRSKLSIDKVSRDKLKAQDSVIDYLMMLKRRAREFGIVREQQLGAALELFNELVGIVTAHDNMTEAERNEMRIYPNESYTYRTDDVLRWVREYAFPKYGAIDEHFRHNSHRFWRQEL